MPPYPIPPKLLLIAQSGRMLAQLAADAGFMPLVIDCYADSDTRQLALASVKVRSLRLADIQAALVALHDEHGFTHAAYGSGFENHAESLDFLGKTWRLLGNSAEAFAQMQDKPAFFQRLAALGIPFPETRFSQPNEPGAWLLKSMRGEGGLGVQRHQAGLSLLPDLYYWQRLMQGETMSATFIAAGAKVQILGFNRQWTVALDEQHPFVFAGVANHACLAIEQQGRLSAWLAELAEYYGLQGLGSLDFILADGQCYVLEINARIPASAQLYGQQVFSGHVQASLGDWPDIAPIQAAPAAIEIVYAAGDMAVPKYPAWPDWVRDRPEAGAFIGKGQPICSIIAAGKNPISVSKQLRRRRQIIENILNTGS